MTISITPFKQSDIDTVYNIQRAAFEPLYEKYHDDATSPYLESRETLLKKYTRAGTAGYVITLDGEAVGAVRVTADELQGRGRISALCVLPKCQGRGVAQKALLMLEGLYPCVSTWSLDTIAQESGNCHLYEKLGYRRVGGTEAINDRMTLVFYEKKTAPADN